MSAAIIHCPNPVCQRLLNLPSEAIGKPISCPYCRSSIRIEWSEQGAAQEVRLGQTGGLRIPRMLQVPGFLLLILGVAGIFVNLYVAGRIDNEAGFALTYARDRVRDLRQATGLSGFSNTSRDSDEVGPWELFAAAAGPAALATEQMRADEELAQTWAPRMQPLHYLFAGVSLISAIGGVCILRGRGYWFAFIGCLAAILNLNNACCFPGAIGGIWGILVLIRDDGRVHFGIHAKNHI